MIEVRFNRGLYLPEPDLWLDPWDARDYAFVSHAHADHFARHDKILCSSTTGILVRERFNTPETRLEAVDFHTPVIRNGFRLRLLPAGHILGSAMLHVTRIKNNESLLYTGDFKTRRSRTAEAVSFVNADTLILETTFGLPQYVFPPQMEVESSILRFIHDAFADGETPILLGYSLGKAQEAYALLTEHEIPCLLHPSVAEMTRACRLAGAELPEPAIFEGPAPAGHVIIAPPNALRSKVIRSLKTKRTAMLTGWALQQGAKYRYQVDEVIPLSDHADHAGLLEALQRVRPRNILTVHGFTREFAAELRATGKNAWSATGHDQLELAIHNPQSRRYATAPRLQRPISAFADFTDTCRLVGETSSRVAKTGFIANYLRGLESDDDLRRAANWLSGRALPRSEGALHIGTAALRRALLALPGAQEERYREISLSQNDSARTARLVLQELQLKPEAVDLLGMDLWLRDMVAANGALTRITAITERLRTLHPAEGETLVKLLTGDLRIGLKEGLLEEAIAEAFEVDLEALRHAHMLTGDLSETAVLARQNLLDEASLQPFVPLKCMLAAPEPNAQAVYDRHHECFPKGLPQFWLEPKYDGIRAQLHKVGDRVSLYSRDLRVLDAEFPDLLEAARELPWDAILDGELIANSEDREMTFFDLQKRLGRRHHLDELLGGQLKTAVQFIAFDILWHAGQSLVNLSLEERRQQLDSLHLHGQFHAIHIERASTAAGIADAFKRVRTNGHEGLIIKDPSSVYSPGRRGKAWLKLKQALPTLDCVVVAAECGHGRRNGLLSDYTFAVRDENSGDLKVIGKAYSGLTDLELETLTEHFKRHSLRAERRKHWVEPNVVLEIAFDSIQPSKRHDSGLALRFPRIKSIRRDKTAADIDSLQYALSMVEK